MAENYERSLDESESIGSFIMTSECLKQFKGISIYHSCHLEQAKGYIDKQRLNTWSSYELMRERGAIKSTPCVWMTLNSFIEYNYFGPIQFKLPIETMLHRKFIVFQRTDSSDKRERYFFVETERHSKYFTKHRDFSIQNCFKKRDQNKLGMKRNALYYFLLSSAVPMRAPWIEANTHSYCKSKRCSGMNFERSHEEVKELARYEFKNKVDERLVDLRGRYSNVSHSVRSTPFELMMEIFDFESS